MYSYFEDRNRFHNTFGEYNIKYECVKLPSLLMLSSFNPLIIKLKSFSFVYFPEGYC